MGSLVALDDERVVAVADGNFVDTTDVLYVVDLTDGSQTPILTSDGSFTLGISAYDSSSGMLYVPDAAAGAVVELDQDAGGFVEIGSVEIAPGLGLPPTQVYLLD